MSKKIPIRFTPSNEEYLREVKKETFESITSQINRLVKKEKDGKRRIKK